MYKKQRSSGLFWGEGIMSGRSMLIAALPSDHISESLWVFSFLFFLFRYSVNVSTDNYFVLPL